MLAPINIFTIVDVSGALSERSLENRVFMMDTSLSSTGQGTGRLATACCPGQRINWIIHQIDVQTPALIQGIHFLQGDEESSGTFELSLEEGAGGETGYRYWAGTVPCYLAGGSYRYRLTIQMAKGRNSVLSIDTPSLNVTSPWCQRDEV